MTTVSQRKFEVQQAPTRWHWRSQWHPGFAMALLLGLCVSSTSLLLAEPPEPEEPQPASAEAKDSQAEEAKPAKAAPSDLDKELLEGLGGGLLDDLPDLGLGEPEGKKMNQGDEPGPPKGQDIEGLPGESNDPLTRIGQQMRRVENRIAQRDASKETQNLQEEIVSSLDELIKKAQEQQNSQNNSSSSKKPPGSQRSKVKQPSKQQAGNQAGNGSGQTSTKPARDSSDRLGPDELREVNMDQMRDLIKDVWGNLPERMREQMNQDAVEEFLPKYRLQIEEYFRRLAEDREEGR